MERICSKCGYRTRAFGISLITGDVLCPYCKSVEKNAPGFQEAKDAVMAELGLSRSQVLQTDVPDMLPETAYREPGDSDGTDGHWPTDGKMDKQSKGKTKKKPKAKKRRRRH